MILDVAGVERQFGQVGLAEVVNVYVDHGDQLMRRHKNKALGKRGEKKFKVLEAIQGSQFN